MVEEKNKSSIWQKLLLLIGIVSFSALVFPFLSLILLGILAKLMPANGSIGTFVVMTVLSWQGVFLGMILGLIIGIIVIYKIKKYN